MARIAVLIACYNRKAVTLKVLALLSETARLATEHHIQVFLLDDASTDGTGNAVRSGFPAVQVLQGTGKLFWNRGMCVAYKSAAAQGPWDVYILMNDDVSFEPGVFLQLLSAYLNENRRRSTIMVGAVASPTGTLLFGGLNRVNKYRPAPSLVAPNPERFVEVDTMSGNLVMVPGGVMTSLKGFDPVYHHGYGDVDLGYRARKQGTTILLYSRVVGITMPNPPLKQKLSAMGMKDRLEFLFGPPNGLGQYLWFVWQHGCRPLFPIYLANMVAKRLRAAITARV